MEMVLLTLRQRRRRSWMASEQLWCDPFVSI